MIYSKLSLRWQTAGGRLVLKGPMNYENRIPQIDELKREIDHFRPLSKNVLAKLKEFYRIGLTYSSNALEGNSLTETETKIVLEDGITIGGKPLRDHYEAVGHSQAYDLLYQLVKEKSINEQNICDLHRLFYVRINGSNAGQYRRENVIIAGAEFIPPHHSKVPALMKKFASDLQKLGKKHHPVEHAAIAHKDFVTIHPFIDGNGRTARLLMNLILLQRGYVITIIPPILRTDYINMLKKAQKKSGSDRPFIDFISCCVYESMNNYLRLLKTLEK